FFFLQKVNFKTIKIKVLASKNTDLPYFCIFVFAKKSIFAIKLSNSEKISVFNLRLKIKSKDFLTVLIKLSKNLCWI
ncbi:hypothetical protein, partial [Mesomycoplasma ovipneumoniae]